MSANSVDERLVASATGGNSAAFSSLVEPHRRELQVHAYRMLGSLEDAEDAVQEALLRAWRSRRTYDHRATFRAWLYRITTNVCLRMLERRPKRLVHYENAPAAAVGADAGSPTDLPWLQPFPDRLLDESPGPADEVVARETIELAFLAAIQHLPPRQRAVLILRDTLDWSADQTADVLDMSVPATNSALQRARATMQERLPAARVDWANAADAEEEERSLLARYMSAWERRDPSELVALLHEDVRMAMPPYPAWFAGRRAVMAFVAEHAFEPTAFVHRFVPTRANRHPAFGVYRVDGDESTAFAIHVVEMAGGVITDLHWFLYPELFPAFGLPDRLP